MLIAYKKACIVMQLLRWMYTITDLEVVRYSIGTALDFESMTSDTDKIFKRCSLCAFLSLHGLIIAENTIWSVENLIDSEANILRWDHEKFHIWQCSYFTKIRSPCVWFHYIGFWLGYITIYFNLWRHCFFSCYKNMQQELQASREIIDLINRLAFW